ncbi:MAG: hypothetical protein K6B68_01845 [Eubacterium sp.]|nr:hypothetical protein [Eubacterium sp.]
MGDFTLFNQIRSNAKRSDTEINNHEALGVAPGTRGVQIAWMYPDILNLHGGRGDVMALLQYSNLMKLPCTIRRVNMLTEDIPFDWADMILFPSGDLSVMEGMCKALAPQKARFQEFMNSGKVILAIGSSGAIISEGIKYQNGTNVKGLGLLGMVFKQRVKVHGDDLWISLPDGRELIGTQIQLADVSLREEQEPLGKTIYGRGNSGKGREGARSKNVIFTHLLGPVLTRNPRFAEELLKISAESAGLDSNSFALKDSDIKLELAVQEDVKEFIQKKINGEIK